MRLSEKYPVPAEIALLYDFVNSLDARRYVERGAQHAGGDELATIPQLEDWLRARGLLEKGERVGAEEHDRALRLRDAVRSFLRIAPEDRLGDAEAAACLSDASAAFPLVLNVASSGAVALLPMPGSSGLGRILAELHLLAETGRLDRLKMCASDECQWVFYDRSKPGKRRWCSSLLCGNRQKTRAYRSRRRANGAPAGGGDHDPIGKETCRSTGR